MAVETNKILGRAGTGAAIGSLAGPWGTAIGAGAGGLVGLFEGLFGGDGGQGAVDAAGAEKMRRMDDAYKILLQQREGRQQTQINSLANRMGAYQGANNVLASMYGPMGSMAPNISQGNGGGPTMGTGHLPDPNAGSKAGYRAGSSAPPVVGPTEPAHVAPGPGYTWQSQGTQGGGVWRPPALNPAVSQIAGLMSGGAPSGQRAAPAAVNPAIASIAAQMGGGSPMGSPLRRAV